MVDYYEKSRRAAIDLNGWVGNETRGLWSEFVRVITLRYGFSRLKMERMLKDNYPLFSIVNDKLKEEEA